MNDQQLWKGIAKSVQKCNYDKMKKLILRGACGTFAGKASFKQQYALPSNILRALKLEYQCV